jgi:lantibiotic modifying enzyme
MCNCETWCPGVGGCSIWSVIRIFQLLVIGAAFLAFTARGAEEKPYDPLIYAKGAGQWILSLSKTRNGALTWPVNDTDRKEPTFDLYSGMPGGILLVAELGKEDPAGPFRQAVPASVAGLESLRIADAWGVKKGNKVEVPSGLYSGIAGVGWLYLELYRITGEQVYREKAQSAVAQLLARQINLEGSALWDDSNDIMSGAAGTGLFLLRAAEDLKVERCLTMAKRAGNYLISQATTTPTGLKWRINESTPQLYPNFSHGTAGVAYFLLRLSEATGEVSYLQAGLGGIQEMEAIAEVETKGNSCKWYHHEGDGEDLWYVGWCHGPAGTARLFYQFSKLNKLPRWSKWVERSANWLIASGIPNPAKAINGYWNESICCGTAGVADFLLDLYRTTGRKEYLQAAEKMAAHLVQAATSSGGGYCWIQAEHRTMADKKDAQTGYAQGAAGFGLFFLKLSRAQRGVPIGWRLPDNPF